MRPLCDHWRPRLRCRQSSSHAIGGAGQASAAREAALLDHTQPRLGLGRARSCVGLKGTFRPKSLSSNIASLA